MKTPSILGNLLTPVSFALLLVFAVAAGLTGSVTFNNLAAAETSGSSVRPPAGAAGGLPVVIQPQPSDSDSWRRIRRGITGTVSIADKKAGLMVQSEGEVWRNINNGPLKNYGGWLLAAVLIVLVLFFAYRRRIPVEHGLSGETIERFNNLERFTHWLTATCFIILALTGLAVMYGKFVLIPVLGKEGFAAAMAVGKVLHNYLAFPFMIGVLLTFIIWVKDNIVDRYDLNWVLKAGGLLVKGVHPPARKFNFGQKAVFWSVFTGGVVLSVTGIVLMFPFAITDVFGMQDAQLIHAVIALVLIAIIIGHIYIGTLGMVGAFDAMGTGMVDKNWAKEHHSVWVEEMEKGGAPGE